MIVINYIGSSLMDLIEIKKGLEERLEFYKKVKPVRYRFRLKPTDFEHVMTLYIKSEGSVESTIKDVIN